MSNENNGLRSESRHSGRRPTWSATRVMKRAILHENAPHHDSGPWLGQQTVAAITIGAGPKGGAAKKGTQVVETALYLPECIGGSVVNFLVDTGSGVWILAA